MTTAVIMIQGRDGAKKKQGVCIKLSQQSQSRQKLIYSPSNIPAIPKSASFPQFPDICNGYDKNIYEIIAVPSAKLSTISPKYKKN